MSLLFPHYLGAALLFLTFHAAEIRSARSGCGDRRPPSGARRRGPPHRYVMDNSYARLVVHRARV